VLLLPASFKPVLASILKHVVIGVFPNLLIFLPTIIVVLSELSPLLICGSGTNIYIGSVSIILRSWFLTQAAGSIIVFILKSWHFMRNCLLLFYRMNLTSTPTWMSLFTVWMHANRFWLSTLLVYACILRYHLIEVLFCLFSIFLSTPYFFVRSNLWFREFEALPLMYLEIVKTFDFVL